MESFPCHFNVENIQVCFLSLFFFLQAFGSFLSHLTLHGLQQAVWQSFGEVKQEKQLKRKSTKA